MLPLTQSTLDKLEDFLKQQGFKVRYEKGTFKTGACMIQNAKIVVVNKFSSTDVKVQSLFNILSELTIDESLVAEKHQSLLETIQQNKILS